jgi:hypothetical protein
MSSKFSSFEKEQKLFKNWRSYLKKDTASLLKEQIREPEPEPDPEPMLEPEPDPEPEPIPEVRPEDIMAAESELSALEAKVAKMEAALIARREQLVNLRRSTSPATAVRRPRREEEVPEVTWEDLAQHGIYPDE